MGRPTVVMDPTIVDVRRVTVLTALVTATSTVETGRAIVETGFSHRQGSRHTPQRRWDVWMAQPIHKEWRVAR